MSLVYLAGAIDGVGGNSSQQANEWRCLASEMLNKQGLITFLPSLAFKLPYDEACSNLLGPVGDPLRALRAVRTINEAAIRCSSAVLARIGSRQFDTIREIEFAKQLQKPVVLWIDDLEFKSWVGVSDLDYEFTLEAAIARLLKGADLGIRA